MMSELTVLLGRLEEQWRRNGLPCSDRVRPGLPTAQIEQALSAWEMEPSEEVVDWFAWHDGGVGEAWVAAGWRLLSLEEAFEHYDTHVTAELFEEENGGWFPLAQNPGGVALVADCRGPRSARSEVGTVGKVPELAPAEFRVDSLTTLVGWWVEQFESGVWTGGGGSYDSIVVHRTPEQSKALSRRMTHEGYVR
ncbi:SMI1/KNR4 family protein [Kineosporia sp. J2-2]|uniref:SMI1/KNR4 family protein n=1 Tax=Kineosporia corallincola TaxID=2835133 RepID=A0ABS5TQY1_9ACTN|nr:hypothetical protein [Kineosporia corallincola]MBT0773159.1 SMI1/KNR4 family protein [Kineosporia corallincola]